MSGGINRLRVKGGASAKQLYDLQNAYITNAGSIDPREGTTRTATLSSVTAGLMAQDGMFNIFSPYGAGGLTAPVMNPILSTITGGDGTWVSGTTYYFVVTGVDALGNQTAVSNEVNIIATGTTFTPELSWLQVAGVTDYLLSYGTSPGGESHALLVAPTNVGFSPHSTTLFTAATLSTANLTSISVPAGYTLNVLSDPTDPGDGIAKIWFAKPFMGFPYVVAQFDNGNIWHYWLQNNGSWTSSTDYTSASIVTPDIPNGLAYQGVRDFPSQPLWTAETVITSGSYVEPNTPTGFAYQAVSVFPPSAPGSTELLLHFDGTSGSTVIIDSGPSGFTFTTHGAAVLTGAPVEFGTGALEITNQTLNNDYVSTPITTGGPLDINSTTADWTVELSVYWTTSSGIGGVFNFSTASGMQFGLFVQRGVSGNAEMFWGPKASTPVTTK